MNDSRLLSTRKSAVIGFAAAILTVGGLRFALTLSGVPDRLTTYSSMSVVILAGIIYFGIICTTWKDRLLAAAALYLPYTLVAVIGLGYTWETGRRTIFQPHEHMFGLSAGQHLAVMGIGGVTFEPLIGMVLMAGVGWLYRKIRS